MRATHRTILSAILITFCLSSAKPLFAQDAEQKKKLDEAIATMRNIDGDKLSEAEQIGLSLKLTEAWQTLISAGQAGRRRIHEELRLLDKEKIEDDYFKQSAAKALWMGWSFQEAKTIAKIWETTPLGAHYHMAFRVTFDAASTRVPATLPMMKALLKYDQNHAFVYDHAMTLAWPQTLEFIWGVYGPDGRSPLLKVLNTTEDEVTMTSAMILLYQSRYLSALPKVREIAHNGPPDAKLWAIKILGAYGHPDDREFLLDGLKSSDPQMVGIHLLALASYEDLSTVPAVLECLKNKNPDIHRPAITALGRLCCSDSIKALHDYAETTKDEETRKACRKFVDEALESANTDYQTLVPMPKKEADKLLLANCRSEQDLRPQPGHRKLTHEQFEKACKDWTSRGRITGGEYEWVESRHVMAVATSKDIKRLLLLRAELYRRLSDECLEEVRIIDEILRHLSRSRYRKITGLCEKVEAKPKEEKADEKKSEDKKEKKKSKKSKKGKKKAKKD